MRVDLHNHTSLCNHANGTIEEYILKAIDLGIDIYGFSDHAPMTFDPKYRMTFDQKKLYELQVLQLKDKYKDQIKILLGYEVDYLANHISDEIMKSKVDYFIGSVHFIHEWGFDNPEFIGVYKDKNIDIIWEEYFQAIEAMAKSNLFDIVGHIDLIKVFNFLPKKDIKQIVAPSLRQIKSSNMVLELNPAGLRKPIQEQYPSCDILEAAYELDIPITFGSDAHEVEQIGFEYETVTALAKSIGYTKCMTFDNRDRELITF
mgnify:CR=1 FL=1